MDINYIKVGSLHTICLRNIFVSAPSPWSLTFTIFYQICATFSASLRAKFTARHILLHFINFMIYIKENKQTMILQITYFSYSSVTTSIPSFPSALQFRVSFDLLNNRSPFFSILHLFR
jgi:hypothetical protein